MHLPLPTLRFLHAARLLVRQTVRVGWIGAMGLTASVHADDLDGVQVGPHSYSVSGTLDAGADGPAPHSTVGFVVTASSVVVFDAADSAAQAALLLDAIRQLTPKPISHVLLTRHRAGQAEGLAAWKAGGAALVARRPAQPAVAADGTSAFRADLWIDDSTDLLVGGVQIQAVVSAGSRETSPGIAYLLPEDGVLFIGDMAEPGRIPDLSGLDARDHIAVLDELLKLKPRVVVPGRGPAALEAVAGLQLARDYLAFLHDTMGAAVRSAEPFDAAYARADWSRFAALPQFDAFNRANAAAAYQRMAAPPLKPAN
jgi:glyoxylase-like metal-dependent hydrolase (beta-lactamase superfamily II)